jgi:hypothetical protein
MATFSLVKVPLDSLYKRSCTIDYARPDADFITTAIPANHAAVMFNNDTISGYPYMTSGSYMNPFRELADRLLEDSEIYTTLAAGRCYGASTIATDPKGRITSGVIIAPDTTALSVLMDGSHNVAIAINKPAVKTTGIGHVSIRELSNWLREFIYTAT